MRPVLLPLAFATLLVGCSRAAEGQSTDWSALELEGKTLDLIDDARVETYAFSKQGLVAATVGTKGGAIAAPLFYWRVEGQSLVISELPGERAVGERPVRPS